MKGPLPVRLLPELVQNTASLFHTAFADSMLGTILLNLYVYAHSYNTIVYWIETYEEIVMQMLPLHSVIYQVLMPVPPIPIYNERMHLTAYTCS